MEQSQGLYSPALKSLVPFVAGIAVADTWSRPWWRKMQETDSVRELSELLATYAAEGEFCFRWILGFLFVWLVAAVVCHGSRISFPPGKSFGFFVFLFLFFAGMLADGYAWRRNVAGIRTSDTLYYKGVITAPPQVGPHSLRCEVAVLGYREENRMVSCCRRAQLFFAQSDTMARPKVGDGVAFMAGLQCPRNLGNPDEFDYAGYLFRKGITLTAFVPSDRRTFYLLSPAEQAALPGLTAWRIKALRFRACLLDVYRRMGWSGEPLAVLSALTLGDKSGLSSATRRLYAEAGANHLLALSGLHLGLLLAVFEFLLLRRVRFSRWRWPVGIVVVATLWGYVLLAGCPASLIRAALMYSLAILGGLVARRPFTLHTLALAAWVMLVVNPFYLYDVGFRLSFLSLFFILLLQPRLERLLPVRPRWLRGLWRLFTVSLAAQLGTLPLVAYTFHQVPVYASVLSLVVIPLTMLLVYGAVFLAVASLFSLPFVTLLAGWLARCVWLQSRVLAASASLPGALLDGVWPSALQVWMCYFLLWLWAAGDRLPRRWRRRLAVFGTVLLAGSVGWQMRFPESCPSLVFYNNRRCPAVHVICASSRSYLLSPCPDSIPERLQPRCKDFWRHRLAQAPCTLPGMYRDAILCNHDGLLQAPGVTLLQVSDDRWLYRQAGSILPVDYLHVCRGFRGSLCRLSALVSPKRVVLDASLSPFYVERFGQECRQLGWKVYVMQEKGALKIGPK